MGDVIDTNFLEKYSSKPLKKRFFIFFKGKLYKFKPTGLVALNEETKLTCKVLNIKYC